MPNCPSYDPATGNSTGSSPEELVLDLYLLPTRRRRYILISSRENIEALESQSVHRVRQFVNWFMTRRNRAVVWLGRVLNSAYGQYTRLEDRIDPGERVLKAMSLTNRFVVHFVRIESRHPIASKFENVLTRQRRKHIFWFWIDCIISAAVLTFTPVLAPLPGPNVFFYYPFLRLLSHYRAIRGAKAGLNSSEIEFKSLPGRSALEDNPSLARLLERVDA